MTASPSASARRTAVAITSSAAAVVASNDSYTSRNSITSRAPTTNARCLKCCRSNASFSA